MNLPLLLPELLLVACALGVMLWDLWLPKERKGVLWTASIFTCLVVLASTWAPFVADLGESGAQLALGGSFRVDGMALLMKRAFLISAFLVIWMSREYVNDLERGQGEFYTLILFALVGMLFCASVNDFMSLFVALEVVTVSFFVLVAFKRKDARSVEAGLKFLVIGSLSAGLLLYGIAFVYGATGTVFFDQLSDGETGATIHTGIRNLLASGKVGLSTEFLLGAMLVLLGLGFKTSAVPLHVWVPDVYEGAPTPVTAFLSVGSKLAGFVLMLRVLEVFRHAEWLSSELTPFLALIAALTLFYGNLGALPQTNIKRLMGYSSIGQCGYILLGIAAAWEVGISGALFYMTAYVVTNLLAFAVIIFVSRATGSHDIEDYSGLSRKNPLMAAALTVALLSLAGVPPFIGFFGKFMLIGSAFGDPSLRWLAIAGMINVVIAMYYYLCVIKRIYVREPRSPATPALPLRMRIAIAVSVLVLIVGGLVPQFLADETAEIARDLDALPTPAQTR